MGPNDYLTTVTAMWRAMGVLQPAEFMRFTGHAAFQISDCIAGVGISTQTDLETLQLVLPMPFAVAMATAHVSDDALPIPPDPFGTLCVDAATACRQLAAEGDGMDLPIRLGTQAARAVLEGVDDSDYLRWAVYRSYIEVLLKEDPLLPDTEQSALAMFQSGLRVAGRA